MKKDKAQYFDPQTCKYPYPIDTDNHYLVVKKNNGLVFDEKYPFIDNRKSFKFVDKMTRLLLYLVVFPLSYIRMGLKVKGKKNLKKNKELIKKGVVSVCNHVHMWDYICIMNAVKPFKTRIIVWAPNVRGENGSLIRHVGGIPIPDDNMKGTMACFKTIDEYLKSGGWLHVYPEGSMWEYYAPIRPFKTGSAYFACESDKPIIPLAFSYRKPGWLRRKLFHQIALFTINIGEPIFANNAMNMKDREIDLTNRCHDAVCSLAGIDPEKNIYEKIFNNSKRVDYYTKDYGIGYKGSF